MTAAVSNDVQYRHQHLFLESKLVVTKSDIIANVILNGFESESSTVDVILVVVTLNFVIDSLNFILETVADEDPILIIRQYT